MTDKPIDLPILEQIGHLDGEAARAFPTSAQSQYPLAPSSVDARERVAEMR